MTEIIRKPLDMSKLTKEEFDAEIQKGIDDFLNGDTYTAEEVDANLKRLYGI